MTRALLNMPTKERFGRYELLKRIDVGGMGEIFLARERSLRGQLRLVALKRLLPQFADQPRYVDMFTDEARIASRFDHPGICQVHDHGRAEGKLYLAMEWIHGVSLAMVLHRVGGGLPLPVVVKVLADAADALDYSHGMTDDGGRSLELIHRDITPPNIMVSFEGQVKLLDFGCAKASTQEHSTEAGFIKGKLRYLAPEQLEDGRELDWRVDVFALGLCGYEALTGRHLFDSRDPVEAVQAVQAYEGPPDIAGLRDDCPPALAAVVQRALHKRPPLRFQTVSAMRDALIEASAGLAAECGARQMGDYVSRLFPKEASSGVV